MISKKDISTAIEQEVAISQKMVDALTLWTSMYTNKSPWLKEDVIKSMNLAVVISNEIARAVTIEMEVEISGSPRADFLMTQFESVLSKIRQVSEYGIAKGGLVFKPYLDGDRILVDYVHADHFFPIEINPDGDIVSCVFVDQRKIGNKYYTRLESHIMIDEGCQILNVAYVSNNIDYLGRLTSLKNVPDWENLEEEAVITNIEYPLFSYFKYPMANNIDLDSALGVSCFSRATELIEEADVQWSSFLWEFESGERALFVDDLAFGKDSEGKPLLPNKRLYRTLEVGGADDAMFNEWSPDYREVNLLNGLDSILKKIEAACGLAFGTLSDPNLEAKTATEIKISKQRTYATITDTQKALKSSLERLVWAMNVWATLGGLSAEGEYETSFYFDDSVIVDKDMQFQQDLSLVARNIMSRLEWRMRNFKETEEAAQEKLDLVSDERSEDGEYFTEGDEGE